MYGIPGKVENQIGEIQLIDGVLKPVKEDVA
jgi:hypothetical protein